MISDDGKSLKQNFPVKDAENGHRNLMILSF